MVKGIVVQSRKTKRGELHRIKSRKWVYVADEQANTVITTAEGAMFKGEDRKEIFIAQDAAAYEVQTDKAYGSVMKFAAKQQGTAPEMPSFFFKEFTALLWLMGRKAALRKFLSWKLPKQLTYIANPYLLYYRKLLDFHSATVISDRTLCPRDLPQQAYAFCSHALSVAYREGRESLLHDELLDRVAQAMHRDKEELRVAIPEVLKLKHGTITFTYDRAFSSWIYYIGKKAEKMLANNPETTPLFDTDDENIRGLMQNRYTVLSGTAGTGKTTLLRKIAAHSARVVLSATTGKAAKLLGNGAVTVHNLLGFGGNGFSVERLDCDLLIVDEASMLDWRTLHAILKAAPRVIFSGDPQQLPPVEGESIFRKVCEVLPVAELTTTWRYANGGPNVKAYPVENESMAFSMVKRIATTLTRNEKTFQVITPVHGGPLGTKRLNDLIRRIVNADGEQVGNGIRMGDKVIVKENVYADGELIASNGQMGRVVAKQDGYISVNMQEGRIHFLPKEVEPAYALTVHKFQGSECDYVIFVIPPGTHREFLTEEMLFVGKTRGKKMTYVVDGVGAMVP